MIGKVFRVRSSVVERCPDKTEVDGPIPSAPIMFRISIACAVFLIALQGSALFLMGQPLICECGFVKVWEGVVLSSGNSQHISDWYTFSHIIHGFLFYLVLWYFFPNMPAGKRFAYAVAIEAGWEVFENTPWVINHYREQALAQGYIGDSVLNSLFDTLAMTAGFVMARKFPVWLIVALGIGMELWVGYAIRDNLTLNILGFFTQPEFIKNWQIGK
jgi:hypothetical protein